MPQSITFVFTLYNGAAIGTAHAQSTRCDTLQARAARVAQARVTSAYARASCGDAAVIERVLLEAFEPALAELEDDSRSCNFAGVYTGLLTGLAEFHAQCDRACCITPAVPARLVADVANAVFRAWRAEHAAEITRPVSSRIFAYDYPTLRAPGGAAACSGRFSRIAKDLDPGVRSLLTELVCASLSLTTWTREERCVVAARLTSKSAHFELRLSRSFGRWSRAH